MNRNLSNVFGAAVAGALLIFANLAQAWVGKATEFAVPSANANVTGIAVDTGKSGNVWYTENNNNSVAVASPDGKTTTEYSLPTQNAAPAGIAQGSDGAFWFCEDGVGQIGRIDSTGSITEYPLGASDSVPLFIALGSDGNMWFTELVGDAIGSITPDGVVTEYGLPNTGSNPIGIVAGSDGNLYFAENGSDNIGQITTAGVVTEFPVTSGSGPNGIAIGSDGNIWYTELFSNSIGKMDFSTHAVTDYSITTPAANPQLLALGADGNILFSEADANQVGRITPKGKITEYTLPTADSGPAGVASALHTGKEKHEPYVYVTESVGNNIARVYTGDNDTRCPDATCGK